MASHRFIRPVSTNYHDFTEQKYEQPDQQIPLKFRSERKTEEYVKKPPRKQKIVIPDEPVVEPPKKVSCWDSCWNSCGCFEPELCQNCTGKLCAKCQRQSCLKYNMCDNCKPQMCPKCKKLISGIPPEPQLRNYPIPIKRQNEYHFENCVCQKCQKLKQPQNKPSERQSLRGSPVKESRNESRQESESRNNEPNSPF